MSMLNHTISINFLFDFLCKCTHTCLLKHWKLKLYHDNFYDFFYHTRSSLYPEKITGTTESFLHRFIMGKPNIHSIWISLNSSWTIFHDSYHLYNWCKIPVVFDYFFSAFCLCGVIETWRNRDWGKVSNFKTEKNDVFF